MSCYFNKEVECRTGDLIRRHPECAETVCGRCGWNPDVERKRREEVKKRYGEKLQQAIH